jgi:type IV secretory pathway TrbD component
VQRTRPRFVEALVSTFSRERRAIHGSLIRPVLHGGMDSLFTAIVTLGAIFPLYFGMASGQYLRGILIAALIAGPVRALGVWLAGVDPLARPIYMRSLSYADHYHPWGGSGKRAVRVRPCIPGAK